ncbi:Dol-P-Glc:Glc(2)Man(9)GlcNAc(2)-PP-Dol alpha-1,2-glucosyltransferase [Choanephora cucurbitarum]|uniref:Dol-P-Glc:Glc(2)Man(9)GlcNAc(2)-PP-Dol alpha-1,2-glucosyltransferase n=1 Tax=Choanephora cucurbitarum TaxID=101091 RepID=A0A1C7NJ62_9FUNG|nr:Dol-P-Glc:Glc(2)Man(9)GlcNAc(2)-PP-Dol alpha-1,2-glucosyltransferase [Choanephora cucurbitarum]
MLVIAHVAVLISTAFVVNQKVPLPYMDEIFHVPQAQQYCQGNYFDWDPKLTTPPGLYVISNIIAYLGQILHLDLCTVTALRFTNLLFSVGLYYVLVQLVSLKTNKNDKQTQLYALALAWFPVHFFYNFVYYTDPGSTFFVLLSYLLVKKRCYRLAGIMGLVSLTFRQTNVIWLCLYMVLVIMDVLSLQAKKQDNSNSLYDPRCSDVHSLAQAIQSVKSLIVQTLKHLIILIPHIVTFLLAIGLFGAFLVWNGGIVLGDRSNHIAGLHFPQIFYFTCFLSFFAAPWTLSVNSLISLLSIRRYEHPFILSDNRHYSFYVWKKVYRRHPYVRYVLTPIYIMSGFLNIQAFAQHNSFLFVLGYIAAVLLSLVPSPLLEFRYFIVPFLLYMTHIPPPTHTRRTYLALSFYALLHIITLYLFIYKPFIWANEPEQLQRFMW